MLRTNQKFGAFYIGLLFFCFISTQASLPTAPEMPEKFTSPQQYKDYINKLKEYYEIINRPRWGRRSMSINSHLNEMDQLDTKGAKKFLGETIFYPKSYKFEDE